MALMIVMLALAWCALRAQYQFQGNWSGLFCSGTRAKIPADFVAGTYRFANSDGYDGQCYRYVAHDPFLRKDYWLALDAPRYRAQRILVPLSAWALGLGRREWIDPAYLAVELIFLFLGVYWCGRLMARRGRSPYWGALFAVLPATLTSLDRMLLDLSLLALYAGFLLYCEERRWKRLWVIAMLAGLAKETGVFLIAALVLSSLLRREWKRAAAYAASAIPLAGWTVFVTAKLPSSPSANVFAFPGAGLLERLLVFRQSASPLEQFAMRSTDLLAVLGLVASLALASWWIWKRRWRPVTISVVLFFLLGMVLGDPYYMADPYGFTRPISPLLLWLVVEAVGRGAWLALLPPLSLIPAVAMYWGAELLAVLRAFR